jgi:hypothetical protein
MLNKLTYSDIFKTKDELNREFVLYYVMYVLLAYKILMLAYGTSVVLLGCLFVPEIMHGRAPEVFLHQ